MPITTASVQITCDEPSTSTVHEARTASESITFTGLATSTASESKMQTRHSSDITTGISKTTTVQESTTVPVTTG